MPENLSVCCSAAGSCRRLSPSYPSSEARLFSATMKGIARVHKDLVSDCTTAKGGSYSDALVQIYKNGCRGEERDDRRASLECLPVPK